MKWLRENWSLLLLLMGSLVFLGLFLHRVIMRWSYTSDLDFQCRSAPGFLYSGHEFVCIHQDKVQWRAPLYGDTE